MFIISNLGHAYALGRRICPTCSFFIVQKCSVVLSNRVFNYYFILGVNRGATEREIKKSYLEKCKEYHPDKHFGDKNMQKKFVEVNEAYQVLSDTSKRAEYDARLFGGRPKHTYQNPYQNWRPHGNQHQKGPRSGPEDFWKRAQNQHHQDGWASRDWGAYEEHFQRQRQNQRSKNSYHYPYGQGFKKKDPLHDFWEHHYNKHNVHEMKKQQYRTPYANSNEQKMMIISFFAVLLIIIWIRVSLSYYHYKGQQQNDHDYFPEIASPNHSYDATQYTNRHIKEESDDDIIKRLNITTDDA